MNIAAILQEQAELRPGEVAILESPGAVSPEKLTYQMLAEQSAQVAGLLSALGVKPGDHVLIFVGMSSELYILLSAIFRLGAVAMFLDPSAGRKHIEHCCQMV